ncbi:hypothetical protein DdX_04010 [Ditylenchus destructor]|uniref:Uncharacterized protein n=1 Tax=Ditylenchus destructor TaxID=166010 RepID=A0AAD4R5D0_9BILA|nr:hypothetical protein DdX_04010 [Ditylenchus destructor]
MPRIEPLISLLGGIPGAATSARSDLSFQPDDLDERLQRMANGSNDGGGVCQNNNNGSWINGSWFKDRFVFLPPTTFLTLDRTSRK